MKRVLLTMVCMALLCSGAGLVMAGPQVTGPVMALHIAGKYKNGGCNPTSNNPVQGTTAVAPGAYTVQWNVGLSGCGAGCNRPFVWLIVANADEAPGIGGISCGIQWGMVQSDPGEAMVLAWTRCSDLEFPSGGWPAPGGGNRLTWATQTNCQKKQPTGGKVTACAGFFYLGSYYNYLIEAAFMRVTKNTNVAPPELKFADCSATESDVPVTAAGWVGINSGPNNIKVPGCNPSLGPCEEPVAAVQATWGHVKRLYRNN